MLQTHGYKLLALDRMFLHETKPERWLTLADPQHVVDDLHEIIPPDEYTCLTGYPAGFASPPHSSYHLNDCIYLFHIIHSVDRKLN